MDARKYDMNSCELLNVKPLCNSYEIQDCLCYMHYVRYDEYEWGKDVLETEASMCKGPEVLENMLLLLGGTERWAIRME